jgi:hypothetical protein
MFVNLSAGGNHVQQSKIYDKHHPYSAGCCAFGAGNDQFAKRCGFCGWRSQ